MEEKLKNLVTQFDEHKEEYTSAKYDESNTRSDFIDKFFECLGWDVRNDKGYAEDYRDVVREDSIHIEGKPKAPDYSFRIGGVRKFFVEAKKPSINIKKDISAAYQLRRYAYTAKLPLSILTDFEEFAVYDTRIKPKANDKASVARVFYCRYDEYEKHWDFIKSTFSRKAILKGSFDKYVKSNKKKRGTSEVDREFLLQIEGWRKELAKNIALRNKNLSIHELNFAVQKIIDRIIFLRIAEDRGMEDYATLRKMTEHKDKKYHIYKELVKYFRHADKKYNSGLFDFESDSITPNLTIDHNIFNSIIKDLYYPNSPYEFSVLPIEILGHIYEQFLGRTIRLTPAHHAKIEYKPEVRKAGGVYYTPQYIVDYIVKNTLGEKLKGKTPGQIKELTVLDPACGSGSFLITAYDHLMKYYLSYYSDETRSEKALKDSIIYSVDEETYRLTIDAKRDILTRHIYGVDIDSQAVEVTKLSLLLKLMENERLETTQHLFTRMEMKLLPDLSDNIKCGNSLIGSDFFEGQQIDMFDDELIRKINAFDWEDEFPKIFSRGGFDVVIGNPPYVKEYTNKDAFMFKKSKTGKYYKGKMDLWYAFASKSIDLMRKDGIHSFIATNNWITSFGASKLREKILTETEMSEFINFKNFMIFDNASVQTMIYIIKKIEVEEHNVDYYEINNKSISEMQLANILLNNEECKNKSFTVKIKSTSFDSIEFNPPQIDNTLKKINNTKTKYLKKKEVAQGIVCPQENVIHRHIKRLNGNIEEGDGIFIISKEEKMNMRLNSKEIETIKPYYTSKELKQYWGNENNDLWIIYMDKRSRNRINEYPNIKKHLNQYKDIITSDFGPYGLHRAREERFFKGNKIISLRKTEKPHFTYSDFPCYVSQSFYIIKTDRINLRYLTAYLNSKIVEFWLKNKGKRQGDLLQVDKAPLLNIPILISKEEVKKSIIDKEKEIEKIIEKIDEDQSNKITFDKRKDKLIKDIDELLYKELNLTPEEIKIVEEK